MIFFKRIHILSLTIVVFFMLSAIIAAAQKPLPGTMPRSKGSSGSLLPSKNGISAKARLPDLVISRLSLDTRGRIQGYLQNKGSAMSAADVNKIEIKITAACGTDSRSVTLTAAPGIKKRQPRFLSSRTDRQNFGRGVAVRFVADLAVSPGCTAQITAKADPDNKIKETLPGERNNTTRARLKSKAPAAPAISPAHRASGKDVPVPAPGKNFNSGAVTRSTEATPIEIIKHTNGTGRSGGTITSYRVWFSDSTVPIDRNSPPDIVWRVPDELINKNGRPDARFRVELLKNDTSVKAISSSGLVFNESEKTCTLSWSLDDYPGIGSGYKICITAFSSRLPTGPSEIQDRDRTTYRIIMPASFSIIEGRFIVESPTNTRRHRRGTIDIIWLIPERYESSSGQPTATFRVDLLREDGSVASQISTRNASYNPSQNRYTLPWQIPASVPNGRYQIKITLRPLNPQGEGGNLTAFSHQDLFTIYSQDNEGITEAYTVYNPASGESYRPGERIMVRYSFNTTNNFVDGTFVGSRPRAVKIQLERFGTSAATNSIAAEWTQFVPEPSVVSGRYVYTHHVMIPSDGSILPGTYGINIKNVQYETLATGISEHFTIVRDETAVPAEPVVIDSPQSGQAEWIVEDEHTVRWHFDRTLGNITWIVQADQGNSGTQVYTVPANLIAVMNNGTAIARFTLPRRFGTKEGINQYTNIKVIGRVAFGTGLSRSISAQTVVKVVTSIELVSPDHRTQLLSMQDDSPYRIGIRNNRQETIHVNVTLKNWTYNRILKSNMAIGPGMTLGVQWYILCEMTGGSHKDRLGPGYRIIVQEVENPGVFVKSPSFTILE